MSAARETPVDTPEDSAAEPSSSNPLMRKKKAELIEELETLRATNKDLFDQIAELRAIVTGGRQRTADPRERAADPQDAGDDSHNAREADPEPDPHDQLARELTAGLARGRNDEPEPEEHAAQRAASADDVLEPDTLEPDTREADILRRVREATADTLGTARSSAIAAKRSAKHPDPPIFYNEEDRDTEGFEQWFRDIENKLSVNRDHFFDDRARQAYVESRLGGKAKRDLAPYLRHTHPAPVNTATKLLVHLWRNYYDPSKEQEALDEWHKLELKMGGDFLTFKNDFVRLAGELAKPRATWKNEFNRKLYRQFRRDMVKSLADRSVGFDQFVEEAQQIAVINKQESGRAAAEPRQGGQNNATRGGRGGARRGGNDKGAGGGGPQARPAAAPQLSAEEVKRLYEERRCFICREKGHRSRECPRNGFNKEDRIRELQAKWATPAAPAALQPNQSRVEELSDSETGN